MSLSELATAKETRHREIVNAIFAQALELQKLQDEKQIGSPAKTIPLDLAHKNISDENDDEASGKLASFAPESDSSQVQSENIARDESDNEYGTISPTRQDSNRMIALQQQWDEKFQQLIEYKEKHGDCLVPSRYPENKQLGAWVSTQRRNYKARACGMTDKRIRLLEGIGFVWATRRTKAYPNLEGGSGQDHRPPARDTLRSTSCITFNNTFNFLPLRKCGAEAQVARAIPSVTNSDESRHSIQSTHLDESRTTTGSLEMQSSVHYRSTGARAGGTNGNGYPTNQQSILSTKFDVLREDEDSQCDEECSTKENGEFSRRTKKRSRTDLCSPHHFTKNVQIPTDSPTMIIHRPTPVSNPNVVGQCFVAMPTNAPESLQTPQGIPQSISFVVVPPNKSIITGSCVPPTPGMSTQFYPTIMPSQQPFYNPVTQLSQPTFVLYPFQIGGQIIPYNTSGPRQDANI